VARQRSAKPCTAVRIRSRPQKETPLTNSLMGFRSFNVKSIVMRIAALLGLPFLFFGVNVSAQNGDYRVIVDVDRLDNAYQHNTEIYFDDESWDPQAAPTYGWDPCCDANLILGSSFRPWISTRVVAPPEPSVNPRLSLNGLPHLFEQTDVTLGFLPGELAQFTFTFSDLETLPQGVTVELEDLAQNITQDLLLDNTYTTWGAVSDAEERFILHFYPSSVTGILQTVDQEKPTLYRESNLLSLNGVDAREIEVISLVSIEGRTLKRFNCDQMNSNLSMDILGLSSGIYIVTIKFRDGRVEAVRTWI
jgi:hypothetical protein